MKCKSFAFFQIITVTGLLLLVSLNSIAKENTGIKPPADKPIDHNGELMKKGAGCDPAKAQRELNVNNVRTTMLNGGDMWWDLISAKYEIPKILVSGQVSKNSLFA